MPKDNTTATNSAHKNGRSAEKIDTPFSPRLHGDLLSSSLLAFLRRWNAYGYQLVQELSKAGLASFDSTTVYRTLRQLERAGLVSSFWDTSASGPARRMYALTKAGEAVLDVWLDLFGRYQKVLHSALDSLDNLNRPADGQAEGADGAPAAKGGTDA
ncbi:MAG TPA: helix-turn-helix transcriptional regulator [Dehalococcoidia bacterium]|jgi:poly-beta-hydroxybutyrate-responsive repressor|nr:helix-turn-helix transcriptional regulator [Dehalococcoidia bacterium]